LKRAKRTAEEEKLYREAADAVRPETIGSVLALAADRNDLDTLLKMFDKLELLDAGKPSGRQASAFQGVSHSLALAMHKRAEAKAMADVPRLLDRYVEALRRRKQALAARPGSGQQAQQQQYYQYYVWAGKQQRYIQMDYPTPNDYYDHGAITLLRQ